MDSRSLSQEAVPIMTNNNNNKKKRNTRGAQRNPVSFSPQLMRNSPTIGRVAQGKDLIVESFLCPVSANDNFLEYIINPRWSDRFPSASLTAARYDMYHFEELAFHYFPTTAVTTSPGVVYLGWEPNANRGPPSNVKQINAFEHHTQGPIYSSNVSLRIPKSALGGFRYCRSHPTCSDLNFYDTGRLIIGGDAGTGLQGGYVEVFYKIRFSQYHLEDTLPYQSRCALIDASGTTLTTNVPDGGETVLDNTLAECFSPRGCITKMGTGEWWVPAGKYFVTAINTLVKAGGQLLGSGLRITDSGGTTLSNLYTRSIDAGSSWQSKTDTLTGVLTLLAPTVIKLMAYCDTSDSLAATAQNYAMGLLTLQ